MKKRYLIIQVLILAAAIPLFSQEAGHKWQRISGIWKVNDSRAFETQGKAVNWNYYELLNLNSILTIKPVKNYSSIYFTMDVTERVESPAEVMISFNVTSESQSWFYHLYAFKLSGGYFGLNRASFLYSNRADISKPYTVKNNMFIKEIASADCKVKYCRAYSYQISFEGENAVLYINGEKILSAPFPEKSHEGRIALSSRNARIAIDSITVKSGEQIVFEDDFNEDTIYVKTMKVQRVPVSSGEKKTE